MTVPRVSILMPVYNEESYLAAALDSLYRQTFTSWELVVVDDGSNDRTPEILAAAQQRDSRVCLLRSDKNGLVHSLNFGLEYCRTELVARMDGDDISHPRRLELQIAHLDSHPDVSLVACGFRHFPRSNLKIGMIAYETWQNGLDSHERIMNDLFVESPFVHPSIVCRKVLMDQMNGYRDCGWAEDYDLWLRMARFGARFARLPDTLFFWRDHPERATRTMEEYSAASFRNCKLDSLKNGFLRGVSKVVIAGAGLEGRAWQRMLAAHGIAVSVWIDVDPKKIGKKLHGATVLHPDQVTSIRDRMLVAIGVRGAREQFRNLIHSCGLQEGVDFVCVC